MNIIFPLSVVDVIMGGGLFLCVNSYMYAYVGVHACMCVRLANVIINVKTETKQLICCEEIPTFYRQARFLLRLQILLRQLPHLPHTQLRHCRLTNSVLQLEQKNYVRPLEFGGAKSFLFRDLGGLSPPSFYVDRHCIHSGYFYSASSSPLLLRGASHTAKILCRSFTPKRHKQL